MLSFIAIIIVFLIIFNIKYGIINSKAKKQLTEAPTLSKNRFSYRDLNKIGKLPLELHSSMKAVKDQLEDKPYDSESPLFEFGFELSYH